MRKFEVEKTRVPVRFVDGQCSCCTAHVSPGFDLSIMARTKDGDIGVFVLPKIADHLYPVTMTWTTTVGSKPCTTLTHTFPNPTCIYWGHASVAAVQELQNVGGTYLTVAVSISSIVLPVDKVFAATTVSAAATVPAPATAAPCSPSSRAEQSSDCCDSEYSDDDDHHPGVGVGVNDDDHPPIAAGVGM